MPQPFDTLHYTEISEAMCRALRDYKGQIYHFVTQRSDVIETVVNLSEQLGLGLHLTRLQLDNPYSTSVSYTKEQLVAAVEHRIEVR